MACVVAIDAGTTGVRAVAFTEEAELIASSYRELTQHFPRPGWVEHDLDEIWALVQAVLAELAGRDLPPVAAVGITNQRETAVAWDRRTGRPLHRAIVWQDRRTADRCDELTRAGHLPLVRRKTGLVLDPYFSATKFEWLLGQLTRDAGPPSGVSTIDSLPAGLAFGTVDAWVLWQLTGGTDGGVFATDVTNASRTMLFDIHRLAWDDELCGLFGVPRRALPDVHPSCGRRGTVRSPPDSATRAFEGVPVSGVAGDQHAALFGQACFEPGLAKVTYGTGSFVVANAGDTTPEPADGLLTTVGWDLGDHAATRSDANDRSRRPPVVYALEGSAFVSGAAIQWLRDVGLVQHVDEIGPLAESVPDAAGCYFVPALTGLGSPWWDPRARGIVTGITTGTGTAHLARAAVEALAFQVRDIVEAMAAATGRPLTELRADGGASVLDLVLQLQADQLRARVVRPRNTESTALGAAMLAGLAEGVWSSLEELAGLWHPDLESRPTADPAVADLAYAGWRRAVDRSRGWAVD